MAFIEDDHAVVVDASGAQRVHLPDATSVAWSADGAWLAYVRDERLAPTSGGQPPQRRVSIWRVRSDGTDAQLVVDGGTPSPDFFVLAGWSPDGTHLLFWRDRGFSASLMADGVPLEAVPVTGGPLVTLAPTMLVYPDFLAWAPDGRRLALVEGGPRSTWYGKEIVVGSVAAPPHRLSAEDQADLFPAWSPDGQWLAYTTASAVETWGGSDAKLASSRRRIALMHPDGTGQHLLTNAPDAQDERPRWSRDGQMLLFNRVQNGQRAQLWLMRADGSDPRLEVDELDLQALTGLPTAADPAWSGFYGYVAWYRAYDWWQPRVGSSG